MRIRIIGLWILSGLLSSCVFVPKEVKRYDANCEVSYRQYELEYNPEFMSVGQCSGPGCLESLLVGLGFTTVISGTAVLVGNTLHWLEKEGRCILLKDDDLNLSNEKDQQEPEKHCVSEEILDRAPTENK